MSPTKMGGKDFGTLKSSRVIIGFKPQAGPQVAFIRAPFDIVVYGGARGGGKSFASLGEFWCTRRSTGKLHGVSWCARRARI